MKLDRNNYEEFFLLYVDNELTAAQRKSVEQFVQENPDLARDLEILQQTVLSADDTIVFNGKNSLLKNEICSLISLDNYEEYLISYIDGELNAAEKKEFEKFAMAHPQVKEELSIYLQTKLEPEEEIVFTNKEVLYRREEKVRVVTMQWWKIAVAAAVILVAGVGTFTALNKKDIRPGADVVKTNEAVKKSAPAATDAENKTVNDEQKTKTTAAEENVASVGNDNNIKTKIVADKTQAEEKAEQRIIVPENVIKNNNNVVAKTDVPVKKIQETNTVASTNNNTIDKHDTPAISQDALNSTIAVIDNSKNAASKQNTNNNAVTKNPDTSSDNKEVQEIQTEFDELYASNNESKNRKLRGFFRKATRVFEKRTNISATDDTEEKIMIGALAVKLK